MVWFGDAASGATVVCGAGCPGRGAGGGGGGAGRADRGTAGRGRGAAAAGGQGFLELLPAPQPGRSRGEGGEKGRPAGGAAGTACPPAGRAERPSGRKPGVEQLAG